MLLLSKKLNASLDALMSSERSHDSGAKDTHGAGLIVITSPNENVITACRKVTASGKLRGGKRAPRYALFGVGGGSSFWGESTTFLGWYADQEQISKEMEGIRTAISQRLPGYTLRYSAKTERRWASVKMVEA